MPARRRILLAASALALALLCAEGGARLLERLGHYRPKRPVPVYMQPNPFLSSALRPGSDTRPTADARVRVNRLGFRGDEIAVRKPDGVFRIVALGGSTTFGYHNSIPSNDETWPTKLERALARRLPGRKIEVVNAGVPGYTLRNSLINFVSRVTWLEPDLVIVYHGVNDASAFRSREQIARSVIDADITRTHAIGLLERTLAHSYVFLDARYRIRKIRRRLAAAPTAEAGSDVATAAPSPDEPLPATLDAYERNLRNLVLTARAAGTDVVLVRQALMPVPDCTSEPDPAGADAAALRARICLQLATYYPHLGAKGLARTFDAFAAIQRDLAHEFDLVWIDADAAVPDTPEYHSDLCHFHPAGTTRVAEAIADGLTARIVASTRSERQQQSTSPKTPS
jgi:lysophospholipase L1-like esterase